MQFCVIVCTERYRIKWEEYAEWKRLCLNGNIKYRLTSLVINEYTYLSKFVNGNKGGPNDSTCWIYEWSAFAGGGGQLTREVVMTNDTMPKYWTWTFNTTTRVLTRDFGCAAASSFTHQLSSGNQPVLPSLIYTVVNTCTLSISLPNKF